MRLRYSPTSPYVRKVWAVAHELGLADRIELVPTNPWESQVDLLAQNPLSRVPTLVTADGMALYDSRVICEYLDSLHGGRRLFPETGNARWPALRNQALGDGILDAAVARRIETVIRPADRLWHDWVARQNAAIHRALDSLEADVDRLHGPTTIGHFAVGSALAYLEFRFADDAWLAERPGLADWYDGFSGRPSMTATELREAT